MSTILDVCPWCEEQIDPSGEFTESGGCVYHGDCYSEMVIEEDAEGSYATGGTISGQVFIAGERGCDYLAFPNPPADEEATDEEYDLRDGHA